MPCTDYAVAWGSINISITRTKIRSCHCLTWKPLGCPIACRVKARNLTVPSRSLHWTSPAFAPPFSLGSHPLPFFPHSLLCSHGPTGALLFLNQVRHPPRSGLQRKLFLSWNTHLLSAYPQAVLPHFLQVFTPVSCPQWGFPRPLPRSLCPFGLLYLINAGYCVIYRDGCLMTSFCLCSLETKLHGVGKLDLFLITAVFIVPRTQSDASWALTE